MNQQRKHGYLVFLALALGVLTIGALIYEHFSKKGPGVLDYQTGNQYFKDKNFTAAIKSYEAALSKDPKLAAAFGGIANSYIQMQRYHDALAVINQAINLSPEFGGYYATRGIIQDHLARYKEAIADYTKAVQLYPEVADGMHWLDRLLGNVQEKPPTVIDRLIYLKKQMALPVDQRLLKLPQADNSQPFYEQ